MKQYKIFIDGIQVGREEWKVCKGQLEKYHFHCVGTKDRSRQVGPYPEPYDSKEEVI
jgi:hypothetical protein